jgi:Subtilisin inhibitor-like
MVLSRCAAAAACALLAAACGSTIAPGASSGGSSSAGTGSPSTGSTSTGSTGASSAGTTSAAKISLDVSFAGSATTPASHFTLRCEPPGGTVRDAAVACAALLKGGATLFGPPARQHVMCPMMLASAGHATVTGTYLGKPVHESIADGGCDIARWSTLKRVFN